MTGRPDSDLAGWRTKALALVLLAGGPCSALIFTAITPAMPQIAARYGGAESGTLIAQLIVTMSSLGLMFGGPLAGYFADRLGPRRLLLSSLLAYAVMGSAGLWLSDAIMLLASRLLLGVACAGIGTSGMSIISATFDDKLRSRLLGYYASLGAAIGLLSMVAAGEAVQSFGWRWPFAFYLATIPVFALALTVVPSKIRKADSQPDQANAASLRPLWLFYTSLVPAYIAVFVPTTQGVFVLVESGVTNAAIQGQVIAMSSAANAIGAWSFGRMKAAFGQLACLGMSFVTMGSGHLLIANSQGAMLAAVGFAVTGLGTGLLIPNLYLMVIERADARVRSRAIGLMYSAQFLGSFLNPIAFAPIVAFASTHRAVELCGLSLIGASVVAGFKVHRQRRASASRLA